MARYWVYENWTNRRVRVHRGECGHCKDGRGCQIEDSGVTVSGTVLSMIEAKPSMSPRDSRD